MNKEEVFIVIPTYEPDENIMNKFIDKLKEEFTNILVVNDGCNKKYDRFFASLKKKKIIVLEHKVNLGKGRGLKDSFKYIIDNYPKCKSIVTADCDGQHSIKDIKSCLLKSLNNPSSLILGTRDFSKKQVPFKSRYGNVITRNVFKIFIGLNISDTQTGLRSMSKNIAEKFLSVKGERFDFETNALIECKLKNISIIEVPIKTIYINENKQSHFNPVKDSIMIYKLFIKYILSSISSFIVDIVLFTLIMSLFNKTNNYILIATILSRVISSIYNYFINRRLVFKNSNKYSILKYFILVIIQMFVSGFVVMEICNYINYFNPIIVKVVIDTIIFIINFIIQRDFIFNNRS